jgi:hypothetical protein
MKIQSPAAGQWFIMCAPPGTYGIMPAAKTDHAMRACFTILNLHPSANHAPDCVLKQDPAAAAAAAAAFAGVSAAAAATLATCSTAGTAAELPAADAAAASIHQQPSGRFFLLLGLRMSTTAGAHKTCLSAIDKRRSGNRTAGATRMCAHTHTHEQYTMYQATSTNQTYTWTQQHLTANVPTNNARVSEHVHQAGKHMAYQSQWSNFDHSP